MSIVEKLAAEGHLTAEEVERIGNNVYEFMRAVDSDPSLYKEALEKMGAPGFFQTAWEHVKNVAPYALGSTALAVAAGGAVDLGRSAVHSMRDSIAKSKAYSSMLEENPNLSETDPNMTEKAFNTLYRFNPAYAQDPLVAGTFVKTVLDQERLDIGTVSNLVQAHRQMSESGGGSSATDFFMKAMPPAGIHHSLEKARHEAAGAEKKVRQGEELHRERMDSDRQESEFARQQAREDAARRAEMHDEDKRRSNEAFLEQQARRQAAEEEHKARQAERTFWESNEVAYNDPRLQTNK